MQSLSKIAILEDDINLKYAYKLELEDDFELKLYDNLDLFEKDIETINHCDFALLDIQIHNTDIFAVDVLKKIKIPYFIVSGAHEIDKIHSSFASGAIDFLSKPINFELLKFKVKKFMKPSVKNIPIQIDVEKNICIYQGNKYELTIKERALLSQILKYFPDPIQREELFIKVWEYEKRSPKTIYTHLNNLRKKLRTMNISLEYDGGIVQLKIP